MDDDVAPTPAVTAVRPAFRHVLLAPEAETAVATATRQGMDVRSVVEHVVPAEPSAALLRGRGDRDEALVAGAAELDGSVAKGEDRVVAPEPGTRTGAELVPRWRTMIMPVDGLPGEDLDAQSLRLRVAPVARGAETFLVCH